MRKTLATLVCQAFPHFRKPPVLKRASQEKRALLVVIATRIAVEVVVVGCCVSDVTVVAVKAD
jgi:hypothetical protein